jgi:Protein of unknown function (DUF3631)
MKNGSNAELDALIVERSTGAAILADVESYLARFVAYPAEEARIAHTLWIAHAHLMDAWESTPRIAFLSPEPASGKTRALEATEPLVPSPVEAVNVSPAYLFRKVGDEDGRPTILFDEIDTVFGPKAKENEELRGLLNAGHRRSGVAGRCVVRGKTVETEEIPAYCAVALAGLDDLPDTIRTRSVIIRMRRRAPGERVEPYRRRLHQPAGNIIRDRLAEWAVEIADNIAWPDLPDGIVDRDADVWEPLIAVADAAGGDWPDRARKAAVTLVTASHEDAPSLGVRLLADLRTIFGDREALSTIAILEALHGIEDAPWSDMRGKPLDSRGLSRRLNRYQIRSKPCRDGEAVFKGYSREDLHDAWQRYLPLSKDGSVTSVTPVTAGPTKAATKPAAVTLVTDVTDLRAANPERCAHCGGGDEPGNYLAQCKFGREEVWLHRGCQTPWMEAGT